MFLEKYKPKTVSGMIGNRLQANDMKRAISGWKRGSAIVLSGPPGCGKTLAIELVANEAGFEVVGGVLDDLLAASVQRSMWSRGKVLVADLDADVSVGDASRLIENSAWPLVLTTSDIYQRHLIELRKAPSIKIIQFYKVGVAELAGFLKKVCASEEIDCDERALYELAQRSDGDVRWALLALESLERVDSEAVAELEKDKTERIFDRLDAIFRRRQVADADIDSLFPWIVENLAEHHGGERLAHAYRCIAVASRFRRLGLDRQAQAAIALLPQSYASVKYMWPRWINSSETTVEGVHYSARKARPYLQLFRAIQNYSSANN